MGLSLLSALMLCMPCYFWLTDYHWALNQHVGHSDESLFWIVFTQTGSPPYAIITILILLILLLYLTRKSHHWQTVVIVCAVSLGTTQAIKSGIKQLVTEPRPYVAQMQTTGYLQSFDLTEKSYYQLKKKERAPIVRDRTAIADEWLVTDYQATELGYSFPSGHTIFAVSWLLLAVGFLAKNRTAVAWLFQAALTIWAAAILYSRVWLGMHYPIDLFVSILLAWVVHLILFGLCVPHWEKKFQIIPKEHQPKSDR